MPPTATAAFPLAARKGLEPLTFGLGNRCSVLLSYRAGLGLSDAMGRGAAPSPYGLGDAKRKTPGAGPGVLSV